MTQPAKHGKQIKQKNITAIKSDHPINVLVEEKELCARYRTVVKKYEQLNPHQRENLFRYNGKYYTFEGE